MIAEFSSASFFSLLYISFYLGTTTGRFYEFVNAFSFPKLSSRAPFYFLVCLPNSVSAKNTRKDGLGAGSFLIMTYCGTFCSSYISKADSSIFWSVDSFWFDYPSTSEFYFSFHSIFLSICVGVSCKIE